MRNKKRYYIGIVALVVLLMSGCGNASTTGEASANETTEVEVQIENSINEEHSKRADLFISAEAFSI